MTSATSDDYETLAQSLRDHGVDVTRDGAKKLFYGLLYSGVLTARETFVCEQWWNAFFARCLKPVANNV